MTLFTFIYILTVSNTRSAKNVCLLKDISENNMTSARIARWYSAWKNNIFPGISVFLYNFFIKEDEFPPLQECCHFVSISTSFGRVLSCDRVTWLRSLFLVCLSASPRPNWPPLTPIWTGSVLNSVAESKIKPNYVYVTWEETFSKSLASHNCDLFESFFLLFADTRFNFSL